MDLNDKIVIYRTADGQTTVDVRMDGDTVWLSQAQMAELFQKDRTVIGRHINNIYKEHELERETTCANFAHTKDYGRRKGFTQTKNIILYNLDVIISVGYRVKSQRGTQFRIWANRIHLRPETVCRKLSNLKKRRLFCLSTLTSKSPRAIDNFSNPLKFCKLCYS